MHRYRWALLGLAAALTAGVLVSALRERSLPSGPSRGGATASSAEVLPKGSRPSAPEFTGISGWLNSSPLTLQTIRGKVVLIDFWTYSCVNCVRTIPHLQALRERYRDRGFEIIGVHSPEFDFEKDRDNVAAAVRRLHVIWPVALDPDMATWNAYNNNVWPAEYLLDQTGHLSYRHLGEGEYQTTENAVATLLAAPPPARVGTDQDTPSGAQTPELYAGSERGRLADGEQYGSRGVPTTYPDTGPPKNRDSILLAGGWADHGQYVTATTPGHVRLSFHAERLLVVAGSESGQPLSATVTVDGQSVPADQRGAGLGPNGFTVAHGDLFPLLIAMDPGHHSIDLGVPAGFQLYTFTFG